VKILPKHKKNPEVGEKKTVYASQVYVEQEDAITFDDKEEITLMDWGNAIVRKKALASDGTIASLEVDLHLEGDFRKTKKKVTWLTQPAGPHALVDVTLLDYDYLITKKKLEEGDDVKDFVTPVTEFRVEAFADSNVSELKKGDIIQFERKGYYIYDGEANGRREFIRIPDGKAAGIASKAGPAVVAPDAPAAAKSAEPASAQDVTSMYKVKSVYGDEQIPKAETKMYGVKSVYDV
jgi:glutamyl-tRNA synthetase